MSEPSVNGVLLKTLKAEVESGYTPSSATIIALIERAQICASEYKALEAARDALVKHGEHDNLCAILGGRQCSCGLFEAQRQIDEVLR